MTRAARDATTPAMPATNEKPTTTPGAGVCDRAHRALTIGLVLTVAFTAFEALAVATALPATVADIGGLALYGWTFSAFMLANLVGIVAAGGMADTRGPAAPFALGVALFVVGLAVAGVAPSMPVVVAGRFVQGFGAGAVSAVSYVAIASAYDEATRPRMLALLSSAWVVPGLVGPALAGFVADHAGWRPVFLGLVPPTLLAAALAVPPLRALPRAAAAVDTAGSARRLRSALLLAAGVGAALAGVECEHRLTGAPVLVTGLAIAGPALVRLMPPGTLRAAPGQPAAIVVMALLGVAFFGAEAFLPLALTDVRGRSAAASGLPLTLGTIAWTAGAWIQERTAARRSRRGVIALGLVLLLAGIVALAGVLHASVPVAVAYAAWSVTALGMGIAYSTTALAILEHPPPGRAGESSAALQLATNLGIALGTGAGGAVLAGVTSSGGSTAEGIAAAWAASAAALVLALAVTRRLAARPADDASRDAAIAGVA
ncbi:MAG: MFS transporter [Deltaproteobacteria bacterium]|nr:MFS transporter [Deltaproteobacteria bacterium]